jgi:hypothetical protein
MKAFPADTLLIGAVLEHMGRAQAQSLLDQIHKGLRQYGRDARFAATERRRVSMGIHGFTEDIAS